MSYPTRSFSSHMRAPSSASAPQSPALVARIEEKKAELENLKELRDLSANVASQMEALEQKLSTLSEGTEGKRDWLSATVFTYTSLELTMRAVIAAVVGNWHNVLRAINMASCRSIPSSLQVSSHLTRAQQNWQRRRLVVLRKKLQQAPHRCHKPWFAFPRSTHQHCKRRPKRQKQQPRSRCQTFRLEAASMMVVI